MRVDVPPPRDLNRDMAQAANIQAHIEDANKDSYAKELISIFMNLSKEMLDERVISKPAEFSVAYVAHPAVGKRNDGDTLGKLVYDCFMELGVTPTAFLKHFKGGCYNGQLVKSVSWAQTSSGVAAVSKTPTPRDHWKV